MSLELHDRIDSFMYTLEKEIKNTGFRCISKVHRTIYGKIIIICSNDINTVKEFVENEVPSNLDIQYLY